MNLLWVKDDVFPRQIPSIAYSHASEQDTLLFWKKETILIDDMGILKYHSNWMPMNQTNDRGASLLTNRLIHIKQQKPHSYLN